MVYLEIITTLNFICLFTILILVCASFSGDTYDPPPMSEASKSMYS